MWDFGLLVDKVALGQVFTSTLYPTIIIPPLKVRPRTGLEGPEGKKRYSSTLSLTSALDGEWVVNATSRPLYPRGRDPVPIV